MKSVFNSSPVIFLIKIGIIEAALDLFERMDISSLVYSEIRQQPDASTEAVETSLEESVFRFQRRKMNVSLMR